METMASSRTAAVALAIWLTYGALLLVVPPRYATALAQGAAALVIGHAWTSGVRAGLYAAAAYSVLAAVLYGAGVIEIGSLWGEGRPLPTLLLGMGVLFAAGGVFGLLSERAQAQLGQRRESEERYVLAARGANDGLWDWDLSTDHVFYSPRWREILGYGADEEIHTSEDWLSRVHPTDVARVRAQVQAHIRGDTPRYENEHRICRRDGSWVWVLTRGICTRDHGGQATRMTGWLSDISDRKQNEARLRHYAFHDALTGLPNRALFLERVQHALNRLRREPDATLAVMLLDLDRFKNVNDSLGHMLGDEMLTSVADRLQHCVREGDTVARLGGDEFTLLLEQLDSPQEAMAMAARVQRAISSPLDLDGNRVSTPASIGVAILDPECDALTTLRRADQAMYAAKHDGKGRQVLFDPELHARDEKRLELETALRRALDNDGIEVAFQPIVELSSGQVLAVEALARWTHPSLGAVDPRQFVAVAQDAGLAQDLGWTVITLALQGLRELRAGQPERKQLRVSVNVTFSQVCERDWVQTLARVVQEHGLQCSALQLDIREDALMEDSAVARDVLRALKRRGVAVHMDDFGTGYSSLSNLHRFPVDALKVDASFIGQLGKEEGAEQIVSTVVSIARDLGLVVIAEGVEREEQLKKLRQLGCHAAQGYHFCEPVDLSTTDRVLAKAGMGSATKGMRTGPT